MKKLSRTIHWLFEASILIKGIDGVLEILAGLLLLFVGKARLIRLGIFLTQREFLEDPSDRIAHFLLTTGQHLFIDRHVFVIVWLLAHGMVKVFLVLQLYREKLWAFPVAMGILSVFVCYQSYRLLVHFSIPLLIFTLLDLTIIFFVWNEWGLAKRGEVKAPLS